MRKFTLLMLFIATVVIIGCKKDEEAPSKNIVGKWFLMKTVEKQIENGVVTSNETETEFDGDDFMEFKSNGKAIDGRGEEFTYKVTENRLLLTEADTSEVEDYEITKFTSNELVIYMEDEDGPDGIETYEVTLRK